MNPKDKASELVKRFIEEVTFQVGDKHDTFLVPYEAKQCALICVREILNDNPNIYDSDRLNHTYWKKVSSEIDKL